MDNLVNKLTDEIKSAMLVKNELKRDTLRFLKGELERKEKNYDDEAVSRMASKLIASYQETNTDEGHSDILKEYVMEKLTEEQMREIAKGYVENNGYSGNGDFGKMMGHFKSDYKGQFDGVSLTKIVREILS